MSQVTVTVPGRPVPASRPRVTSHGTYMPQRHREYLALVRDTAMVAMRAAGHEMAPKGVAVRFWVYWALPWPKSARKADRDLVTPMTGTPDVDNALKLVLDALTGVVYADDAQVTDAHVTKRYVQRGTERLTVTATWGEA